MKICAKCYSSECKCAVPEAYRRPALNTLVDMAAKASGEQNAAMLSALCATALCALKALPVDWSEQAILLAMDELPELIDEVVAESTSTVEAVKP